LSRPLSSSSNTSVAVGFSKLPIELRRRGGGFGGFALPGAAGLSGVVPRPATAGIRPLENAVSLGARDGGEAPDSSSILRADS